MTVYAFTGGTFILVVVLAVTILAVIYGTFTYRGSGISPHAGDQTGDAPGAADPATPPAKDAPWTTARSPPTAPIVRASNGLTRLAHQQPEKEKYMADPVPSGSDVSAGTYRCTECGYELTTGSTESLPPCPDCSNGAWHTVTGGDSASDPAA